MGGILVQFGEYLLPYVSGIFAGLSGCVLPVLSVLFARRSWKFALEFFLSQFLLFSALNLSISAFYSLFESLQPLLLLSASLLTFYSAYALYVQKPLSLPASGSLYGLALSPCSLGFAVASSSLSFSPLLALSNALLFSLGISTPLFLFSLLLPSFSPGPWTERLSVLLLFLVSYYLAYLAGASWRWFP